MKLCFECNNEANVEHHVVPRSKGGTKTVPLCNKCHSLVHDTKSISLPELSKLGKKRVQDIKNDNEKLEKILNAYNKAEMAREFGLKKSTLNKIITDLGYSVSEIKNRHKKEIIEKANKLRNETKMTWKQIAQELNIDYTTLYEYNIPQQHEHLRATLTEEKKKVALKLKAEGKKWTEVAEIIGVSYAELFRNGLNKESPHKVSPGKLKLTEEKKELAIKLRKEGKQWKEIASIVGVTKTTLFQHKLHKKV